MDDALVMCHGNSPSLKGAHLDGLDSGEDSSALIAEPKSSGLFSVIGIFFFFFFSYDVDCHENFVYFTLQAAIDRRNIEIYYASGS